MCRIVPFIAIVLVIGTSAPFGRCRTDPRVRARETSLSPGRPLPVKDTMTGVRRSTPHGSSTHRQPVSGVLERQSSTSAPAQPASAEAPREGRPVGGPGLRRAPSAHPPRRGRGAASVVRRLDDCVAEDLGRAPWPRRVGPSRRRRPSPTRADGTLAAVPWGQDRIDLFWVGADRTLAHRIFEAGKWSEPESLGGTLASPPAVTAWAAHELQVFAVFPDGALWNRYWDGRAWHDWESLGGDLAGSPGCILVGRRPDRRLGRRCRRAHLAPLVGRGPLGRLGAAGTVKGRSRINANIFRHDDGVRCAHERHRHHPRDHLPHQDRRRVARRAHPEQYRVLREKGTERAFTGALWDEHRAGTYRCAGCGTELFRSDAKFESGTGWPSFFEPTDQAAVDREGPLDVHDPDRGAVRDLRRPPRPRLRRRPEPTGLRYCINSAALKLDPAD